MDIITHYLFSHIISIARQLLTVKFKTPNPYAVLLFVLLSSSLWAQENPPDLRDLAVAQIYEYARELYDRGDYEEAARAMGRILQLNPDYAPALAYMRRLGYPPKPKAELFISKVTRTTPVLTARIDSTDPNADLKAQIVAEDNAIHVLNEEIAHMRITTQRISNE